MVLLNHKKIPIKFLVDLAFSNRIITRGVLIMKKMGMILLILLSLAIVSIVIHAEEAPTPNITPVVTPAQSETTGEPDFRKAYWGMTKEEVMQTETDKPSSIKDNELVYKVTLAGLKAEAHFLFTNNKLTSTNYASRSMRMGGLVTSIYDQYYKDYETWKDALKVKYGTPVEDREIWKKESAKHMNISIGEQIMKWNLTLISKWVLDRTIIMYVWDRKGVGVNDGYPVINYYDKNTYVDDTTKKNDSKLEDF
jgi:hypothetical protein